MPASQISPRFCRYGDPVSSLSAAHQTRGRRPIGYVASAVLAALLAFAAAGGIFVFAVRTSEGQVIDQRLLEYGRELPAATQVPYWLSMSVVSNPLTWVIGAAIVVSLVVVGAMLPSERGHRGVGSRIATTATLLLFPPVTIVLIRALRDGTYRPHFHDWIEETNNSAPSGHAAAIAALVVAVTLAAPPLLRPWVAALGGTWAAIIDFGLVAAGWHRPSDVAISTLLIVGAAVLLPDPHRGSTTAIPRVVGFAVCLLTVVAASITVAVYYPRIEQVVIAALVAGVVGVCLGILVAFKSGDRAGIAGRRVDDPWTQQRRDHHLVG